MGLGSLQCLCWWWWWGESGGCTRESLVAPGVHSGFGPGQKRTEWPQSFSSAAFSILPLTPFLSSQNHNLHSRIHSLCGWRQHSLTHAHMDDYSFLSLYLHLSLHLSHPAFFTSSPACSIPLLISLPSFLSPSVLLCPPSLSHTPCLSLSLSLSVLLSPPHLSRPISPGPYPQKEKVCCSVVTESMLTTWAGDTSIRSSTTSIVLFWMAVHCLIFHRVVYACWPVWRTIHIIREVTHIIQLAEGRPLSGFCWNASTAGSLLPPTPRQPEWPIKWGPIVWKDGYILLC